MPNRAYIVTQQPVVKSALAGTAEWARLACKHSDGSLWNNGTWVVRDVRNRPGTISNHARGLAMDLSYRWLNQKKLGKADGRKASLAFIDLMSTIVVFLTGTLSGIVASNGIKKPTK